MKRPNPLHAGNLEFVSPAAAGSIDRARVEVRAKRLVQLCFKALIANSHALELQNHAATASGPANVSWHRLVNLIIKLTGTAATLPVTVHC